VPHPGTTTDRTAGAASAVSGAGRPGEFLELLAAALPTHGFWSMPTLVACSGGADSVALLLGLQRLAAAPGRLVVAHVEHDLRAAAADDREFVARLAARLGLPFVWRRVAVAAAPRGGEGLEARARRLRYEFLEEAALERGARHVVVAHTADDQAETILHRMLRGTGIAGLAGMPTARPLAPGVSLLRPLVGVSRATVREFLAAAAQGWREDETNADTRLARNFLRHELLARSAAGPYPAAAAGLVRLGRQAERVAAALASAAEHLLELHSCRQADGTIVIHAAPLAALDPHLVAEVFVAAWRREGWPRRDMSARHYAGLARLVVAGGPAADLPAGVRVEPAGVGRIRLRGPVGTGDPPAACRRPP
jgi:tRNA(Ile)-lysidine synthase